MQLSHGMMSCDLNPSDNLAPSYLLGIILFTPCLQLQHPRWLAAVTLPSLFVIHSIFPLPTTL